MGSLPSAASSKFDIAVNTTTGPILKNHKAGKGFIFLKGFFCIFFKPVRNVCNILSKKN